MSEPDWKLVPAFSTFDALAAAIEKGHEIHIADEIYTIMVRAAPEPPAVIVERVAKAIYESWGYRYEGRSRRSGRPHGPWAFAMAAARAALSALQDPG